MTPRHRLILSLCAVVLLTAAVPALAERGGRGPWGGGPGFMDGHKLEHLAQRLELSDGQRDALKEALVARYEAGMEARRGLFEARRELHERIHGETFDEAAIRQAAGVVAALEADAAVERAQQVQKMRQILTPEQLAELDELREDRQRFGRRGPRGRGGPGGPGRGFGGPPPPGE